MTSDEFCGLSTFVAIFCLCVAIFFALQGLMIQMLVLLAIPYCFDRLGNKLLFGEF